MSSLLPQNFWVPEFPPSILNTDAQIAATADRFGIRFPPLMIELLRTCPSSGQARHRYLELAKEELVPDSGGSCTVIFEKSLRSNEDWTQQLYLQYLDHGLTAENERDFAGLFSFASDSFNEDPICLDYRRCDNDGNPAVVMATFSGVVQPISDSLDAFLSRLKRTDYENCYCLEAENGEQLWQRLVNGLELQPLGHFRGQWIRSKDFVLVCLDPNVDAPAFEPFLEEPENRWILRASPNKSDREAFRRQLDDLGIPWKQLFEAR